MTLFRFGKILIPMAIFILAIGISAFAQDPSGWTLRGTFFADDSAPYAFLENNKGVQKWVQVGDILDNDRITRIDRGRVVAFDGQREYFLFADLIGGGGAIPTLSLPKVTLPFGEITTAEDERSLESFLNEEFQRLQTVPTPISESQRHGVLEDMTRLLDEEPFMPTAMSFRNEGDENLIPGIRLTTDVQSMGLRKGDILLHINGISLTSPEKLTDILDVTRGSKWITYAFSRNNEAQVRLLEVH